MTISSADDPVAGPFDGNGSQTAFPFSFKVFAKTDLAVVRTQTGTTTTLVLDSDYSVALNADQDNNPGGTITYPISGDALPSGATLTATTDLDAVQTTDIQNLGGFYPQVIEDAFDRVVMLIKQIKEQLGRSIRFPIADAGVSIGELPNRTDRAGSVIAFDENGDVTVLEPDSLLSSVAYANLITDSFRTDGAETEFTLSSAPGTINNCRVFLNGLRLTPEVDYTLSGTTLTLTEVWDEPIDADDNLVVELGQAVPVGEQSSNSVNFLPPGATTSRSAQDKLREEVSLNDYWFMGADPTGVQDCSAAYAYAASQARRVRVSTPGEYRFASPVTLPSYGSEFVNGTGVAQVVIMADHVLGAGIQLIRQHQKVRGMYVKSSATRYAAAVTTFNPGIAVGGSAAGTNLLTHAKIIDNIVEEQPGIGIYLGGEGAGTTVLRNTIQYCKGHGMATDDGTIGSRPSSSRSGLMRMENNRTVQCGGNGVNISQADSTSYRVQIENHESIDCAWNSDISGLLSAQYVLRGQNVTARQCGGDDSGWANTTMSNGKARYAKLARGDNFDVRNGATNVRLENNRSLDVARDAVIRTGVAGCIVDDCYSAAGKSVGYKVEAGTTGVHILITDTSPYTTPVSSATDGVHGVVAGKPVVFGLSSSAYLTLDSSAVATIASNSLNVATDVVMVAGQGGAADDLQAMYLAGSGVKVPAGVAVRVINTNAYNITVKHGLTNIYTKTAADVVLGQNVGITLASDGTNMYEV